MEALLDPCDCMVDDLHFKLTCNACPEQYDVFRDGEQVGYLRLRHGSFQVWRPDYGDKLVFSCDVGDGLNGQFLPGERSYLLLVACNMIKAAMALEQWEAVYG